LALRYDGARHDSVRASAMSETNFIKFLGTAGARFAVTRQIRASGGMWFCLDGIQFMVDPGPGALVRALASKPKLDPSKLEAILLSHVHIDHTNDVNILIEAMTDGGFRRRGKLFAPRDALEQAVLPYAREYVAEVHTLEEGGAYNIAAGLRFQTPLKLQHGPDTYGFVFRARHYTVAYIVDTLFFPELERAYRGDVLILHVVRLKPLEKEEGEPTIKHLSLDDARTLISAIRPKTAILTHFGMTMIRAKPWELAAKLSRELGTEVIAASDGLRFELE
jgi:phosphoribosyl 1,2-cyclic phosphodiesterase